MMGLLHRSFELLFSRLAAWAYEHKYLVAGVMLVMTLLLASQTAKLTIDTRDESFFHPKDPALLAYNRFRDTFGQDDLFILALQSKDGLSIDFLKALHSLHQDLADHLPYLDDITSLANARVVRADGDTLQVGELMEEPPSTPDQLAQLLATIDHYPLYDKLLVSEDRTIASILIKAMAVKESSQEEALAGFAVEEQGTTATDRTYLSNAESVELATAIKEVLARHANPEIRVYLAGTPAIVAELQNSIESDIRSMVPLSYLLILLFLAALFRRVSGVVYPVIVVLFSFLATFGIMALVGMPITNVNQILPTFLLVVGIGDSVHILTTFYRLHGRYGDKRRAIIEAMGYAGLPVLMTSLTTACGLLSFAWADVATVAQLGAIAPAGVMLAFAYTVLLLPALIAIFPMSVRQPAAGRPPLADRLFDAISRVTTHHPLAVCFCAAAIVGLATIGALSVRFSHNAVTWFPPDSTIRQATELLDRVNGGTVSLEILVDSGTVNGLYDADLQQRLSGAASQIPSITSHAIRAGKSWSMADLLKEINRALHQDRAEAYSVPDNNRLIAQELLLFEGSGSDDLEEMADSRYRTARLSALIPFKDAVLYHDYVDKVREYLAVQFPGEQLTLTGHNALFIQIIKNLITSLAKSYIIALLVITLLMVVLVGRVRIGLMSMVANVAPILGVLGLMGVLKIPLDMGTILIGSIILGLVVDDTIHFLHHFRRSFEASGNCEAAVHETLHNTGRALVITSLVLCGGFFIYTTSYLAVNIRFGLLSGAAVLFALAADFFLVPALLSLVYGRRRPVVS